MRDGDTAAGPEASGDVPAPLPLPRPDAADGSPRRVGVEIEFGGLDEAQAARCTAEVLGGRAHPSGAREWTVEGSRLGDLEVVLDTSYRDRTGKLVEAALDLLTGIVPVEIVSAPLLPAEIAELDRLCAALRAAGATGSRAGLLLGFGVHFNPAVAGETVADILPVARTYAFLEDVLRAEHPIDPSRRVLPFVQPYPRAWLDALAAPEAEDWSISEMIDAYLATTPSRNRGLDLLPLFRHLDEARVTAALGAAAEAVSARPTYHYRLPDCRIDEPGWSLAGEWNLWVALERLAGTPGAPARLAEAWRAHRASFATRLQDWVPRAARIAREAGW